MWWGILAGLQKSAIYAEIGLEHSQQMQRRSQDEQFQPFPTTVSVLCVGNSWHTALAPFSIVDFCLARRHLVVSWVMKK